MGSAHRLGHRDGRWFGLEDPVDELQQGGGPGLADVGEVWEQLPDLAVGELLFEHLAVPEDLAHSGAQIVLQLAKRRTGVAWACPVASSMCC